MKSKLSRVSLLALGLSLLIQPVLGAVGNFGLATQAGADDEKKYAGLWKGSYTSSGDGGELSFALSKDAKGQWQGTVRFTNQDGEQSATMKAPKIANGKLQTKIEAPGGDQEVTIEGTFQGDRLEGTYAVMNRGEAAAVETGTWKLTRGAATK